MERIALTTIAEYEECKKYGFEPLVDRRFTIEPKLKREIITKLFGSGNTEQQNERFFRWIWAHKPHYCEECLRYLPEYSAVYCSHILSRGSHPEFAYYPENIQILCFQHHNQFEHKTTRTKMRTYRSTQLIIADLLEQRKILKL